MRTRPCNRLTLLCIPLLVWGLAACDRDTGTEPGGEIDAALAEAAVDSLVGKFLENEAKNSLDGLRAFITRITNLSVSTAVADPMRSAIPTALLGATCVWDPQRGDYVDDRTRTGAPGNGIRFILYTLGADSRPIAPLDEIGHVDIVDLTTGSSVDVSIVAPIAGVPRLEYDVTGTLDQTSYNLTTVGSVSDGASQVDFNLNSRGSASSARSSLSITFAEYDIGLGTSVDATETFTYTATVTDARTGGALDYTFNFDAQGLVTSNSDVKFNGKTVAVWSGSSEEPTLTAAAGSNLTAAQLLTLDGLFSRLLAACFGFADLFLFGLENTGLPLPGTGQ